MSFSRFELEKWIAPLRRRVSNIICKAILDNLNSSDKFHLCKVILQKDEVQSDVERLQPYGLTTFPENGAETVVLNINGDRNQPIVICIGDSRYTVEGEGGDVVLHRKGGNKVHLKDNGEIEIKGANSIKINADDSIDIGEGVLKKLITEDIITPMSTHTHSGVTVGSGVTGLPTYAPPLSTVLHATQKTKAE